MGTQELVSLHKLFWEEGNRVNLPDDDVYISGICSDSRDVRKGNLYVAKSGMYHDGHEYIQNAIEAGAVAVVGSQKLTGFPVPYFRVDNPKITLAELSASFYGFPAKELVVIGVTGTDGKTTTSSLIFNILKIAGFKVGLITTVMAVIADQTIDTGFHVTTPEAPQLQKYFRSMVNNNLTHVVLETTSHGLHQKRVHGCEFDIAVFTNITHEHLDYHGNHQNYLAAKAELFNELSSSGAKANGSIRMAVLNRDDGSYKSLIRHAESSSEPIAIETYGVISSAGITGKLLTSNIDGISIMIKSEGKRSLLQSKLIGDYNIYNILAAFAVAVKGIGIHPQVACTGIESFEGIPGRMERIDLGQSYYAFVDFAHTPNALKAALNSTRLLTAGNLVVVFGSAGLRDKAKRRLMAKISIALADKSIFTAEDPRTESLTKILSEMADGALSSGGVERENFWRVNDRGEAIRLAVGLCKPGDILLCCGKAHEQSMCFGDIEYPWNESIALQSAISESMGIDGPDMPVLPTSR